MRHSRTGRMQYSRLGLIVGQALLRRCPLRRRPVGTGRHPDLSEVFRLVSAEAVYRRELEPRLLDQVHGWFPRQIPTSLRVRALIRFDDQMSRDHDIDRPMPRHMPSG